MTDVSPKKQLIIARQQLDKLSIFLVNMANFYQGANPTFDEELVMLKKQLSGKPDYEAATEMTSKLNSVLTKDTTLFKQRNLESVSHLQDALKKLSSIKNVSEDVKTEVSEFLTSLSPDKHAVVSPLEQFEKALLLYNKALQHDIDGDNAKPQKPEQLALHNTITQELKELIAPFYVENKNDKSLQDIYQKLNIGLDHKELLECCLVMIRFVIKDVIKETTATSRLISNLHQSLTNMNADITTNIADSEKRFEERKQFNTHIKEHMTDIESVVSDSQQLDQLKQKAKQHLDKMQASLKASAVVEQKEKAATIAMMKKMQERVFALETETSAYKQALFTQRVAALSDQLTQLPNRMAYEEKAQFEVMRSRKTGSLLCIAILDIDHFKIINDNYGHSVGDKTLQIIAKKIRQYLPQQDFLARWGGEEFVILLPNCGIQEAFAKIEVVREKISTLPFKLKGQRVFITLSCGLSQITPDTTLEEAFDKADALLYKAKDSGRNQTLIKDIE